MFLVPSFFEFPTWDMVFFPTNSFLPGETNQTSLVHSARVGVDWWIKYIGELCMEWDLAPTVNNQTQNGYRQI
jgi:hypothetical protein